MICDTPTMDGHVYFYESFLEFVPKLSINDGYGFKINYEDIKETKVERGIKSRVIVYLNDDSRKIFCLYKANTLEAILKEAKEGKAVQNSKELSRD